MGYCLLCKNLQSCKKNADFFAEKFANFFAEKFAKFLLSARVPASVAAALAAKLEIWVSRPFEHYTLEAHYRKKKSIREKYMMNDGFPHYFVKSVIEDFCPFNTTYAGKLLFDKKIC